MSLFTIWNKKIQIIIFKIKLEHNTQFPVLINGTKLTIKTNIFIFTKPQSRDFK